MSTFVIGSVAYNMLGSALGQCFVPNVAGPDGSGSPGTASTVTLTSIIVGHASNAAASPSCHICSGPVEDSSDVTGDANYLATSEGSPMGGTSFGTGSYTHEYSFGTGVTLAVGSAYYFYLDNAMLLRYKVTRAYSGGYLLNNDGDLVNASMQFQVSLST